jgi:hypothetical protein
VRWARDGSELFYVAADQRFISVRVISGPKGTLLLGAPVPLFRTEFDSSFLTRQQYVVFTRQSAIPDERLHRRDRSAGDQDDAQLEGGAIANPMELTGGCLMTGDACADTFHI